MVTPKRKIEELQQEIDFVPGSGSRNSPMSNTCLAKMLTYVLNSYKSLRKDILSCYPWFDSDECFLQDDFYLKQLPWAIDGIKREQNDIGMMSVQMITETLKGKGVGSQIPEFVYNFSCYRVHSMAPDIDLRRNKVTVYVFHRKRKQLGPLRPPLLYSYGHSGAVVDRR